MVSIRPELRRSLGRDQALWRLLPLPADERRHWRRWLSAWRPCVRCSAPWRGCVQARHNGWTAASRERCSPWSMTSMRCSTAMLRSWRGRARRRVICTTRSRHRWPPCRRRRRWRCSARARARAQAQAQTRTPKPSWPPWSKTTWAWHAAMGTGTGARAGGRGAGRAGCARGAAARGQRPAAHAGTCACRTRPALAVLADGTRSGPSRGRYRAVDVGHCKTVKAG